MRSILFLVAALALSAPRVADAAMKQVSGYLIDKQCVNLCTGMSADQACTPDQVNVFYNPQGHTKWCLLLQVCIDSGYVLMSEFPDPTSGMHDIVLDMDNTESHPSVLSFIQAGSSGMFPLVTVEYEETTTQEISGVTQAFGVTVRDSWANDPTRYTGEATHQVVCADSNAPNIESNNMCFRSDIDVTDNQNGMYVIESNGCPDHANMQGSKGTMENIQDDHDHGDSNEGGCGAGCGACGACGGGCGACQGACGGGCQGGCGSCGSEGCGSAPGCGSCGSTTIGCDGGNSTAVSKVISHGTMRQLQACDACGSDTSTSCGSDSTGCGACSAGGCSAGCGASNSCGGCSAACQGCQSCGGCGACGSCGPCGGGNTATNGQGHASSPGTYDPMFQHYRAIIPMNPGMPGEAKYFEGKDDDVVGIMSNGVLLDSHKQTWSYDDCNGHSDTKHVYHYHIPPKCFLESMGVAYPDSTFWWANGMQVRMYSDMGAQWPQTGPGSPVIGFALDGFPIFGPYDNAGALQHGMGYGGEVDECNGKMDSNGNYGYYLTVDPPFAPPCLRGNKGYFSHFTTDKACPPDGIETTAMITSGGVCESVDFATVATCAAENPEAVSSPREALALEETSAGSRSCLAGASNLAAGVAAAATLYHQL